MTQPITINLIPSESERSLSPLWFKVPTMQVDLSAAHETLRDVLGSGVQPRLYVQKSADTGGTWQVGEFILQALPVAGTVAPVISSAFCAWIAAKSGRKVKIKKGDTEIEAGSVEEVKQLIELLRKK
ncbi:hypothetical protein [Rhizobium leguminosarum]|uniref:hypothetical protein n=1 Tax=Rhizobium leguminosarum TaxID=384 RepID=UPI001C902C3D|nr:hypothetical protein [Rhizobium leguminosarum]MBY2914154.1 hypothetical protein [Rhizobium leguminosarum]MBY2969693.1 hypothetical protein [Rhizobium leguminosarum]MBY2977066.1 hypothetical protein [Rhizobium leguminosarum]MBY3005616.1 hypothetical protein [Rhizobium leguminosarum]